MVEEYKEDPQSENLPPKLSNVCGNPLCVLKVSYFYTQVKEVNEAASESQSVNDCLLARMRMKLIVIGFLQLKTLLL